jgi:4-hydroxybenzoate polyprenyltransferase
MDMLINVIIAFFIFCGLSGSEYLLNDVLDRDEDKKHPRKRKRPIASGRLSTRVAAAVAIGLIILCIIAAFFIGRFFMLIAILYILGALGYTMALKHVPHVDFLAISALFVIRAWAGGAAIGVRISEWLVICTFLLAMFLAVAKRRHELVLLGDSAPEHRTTLREYSPKMLDQVLTIISAVLLMSYCLYTFLPSLELSSSTNNNKYLMFTIPFVIFGLVRYLYLVHRKDYGGEVEMIFKDRPIVIALLIRVLVIVAILYGLPDFILKHLPPI